MGQVLNSYFIILLITLFSPILCQRSHYDDFGKFDDFDDFDRDDFIIDKPDVIDRHIVTDLPEDPKEEILVPIFGVIFVLAVIAIIGFMCYRCIRGDRYVTILGIGVIRRSPLLPETQPYAEFENVNNIPPHPPQYSQLYPSPTEIGHPAQPMNQGSQVNQHAPPLPQYPNTCHPPQAGRYGN